MTSSTSKPIPIIKVITPALNEEKGIKLVLGALSRSMVAECIVVDNGSSDATAQVARKAGATVLREHRKGYGYACLCALKYIATQHPLPKIVVFLDADYSDYPEDMALILAPIISDKADMVIGSRMHISSQARAMTWPQRWGNRFATALLNTCYKKSRFTDLGPFRAITYKALKSLDMQDKNYGWTIEMQIKALKKNLRCAEVAVRYRKRAFGKSKISGNVRSVIAAGTIILYSFIKYR